MNGSYFFFFNFWLHWSLSFHKGFLWLCRVGLFSGCDAWASHNSGFSCCGAQAPECLGFSNCDTRVQQLWRMQSCPEAYGIVSGQGSNLLWQADSQPLGTGGSPPVSYIFKENKDGIGNSNPLQDSCLENSWTENPEDYSPQGCKESNTTEQLKCTHARKEINRELVTKIACDP